jgi:uncharacterized protein YkwD
MRLHKLSIPVILIVIIASGCSLSRNITPTASNEQRQTSVATAENISSSPSALATPTPTSTSTLAPTEKKPAQPTEVLATPSQPAATATPTTEPSPTPSETVPVQPTVTPEIAASPPPTAEPTTASATETTPTTQPTAAPVSSNGGSGCLNKAAFYGDVTIPDDTPLRQGDTFVKTWRVRNEGTCTWGNGYALVFASGDIMDGAITNPIPSADPGSIIEVSINLSAPASGGTHYGNWEFQDGSGKRFGVGINGSDYIWVRIQVNWIAASDNNTGNTPATSSTACAAQRNSDYENQVVTLINQARTSNGLAPLQPDAQLSAAALAHSMDMACNDFVDHTGSDGSSWPDRIAAQGFPFSIAYENIYVGNPDFGGTPEGAFEWWMNSQVHRDNILNPDAVYIGVGYVFNASSTYGGYYTVDFTKP